MSGALINQRLGPLKITHSHKVACGPLLFLLLEDQGRVPFLFQVLSPSVLKRSERVKVRVGLMCTGVKICITSPCIRQLHHNELFVFMRVIYSILTTDGSIIYIPFSL